MSLINDALKRATSKQITTIPIPPEPAPPMQPVEHPPRRGLPWYFFPTLLAIMAAACWFIVRGVQARQQAADPAATSSTTSVKAREVNTDTPAPSTTPPSAAAPVTQAPLTTPAAVSSPTTPAPGNSIPTEASPPATETPAPAPPTPTAAPEPTEPPKVTFRLQGIFYRQTNPSALLNGRSVWVGSRIDGGTVKAITRDTLTIEFDGQTKQLTLE